MIFCTTTLILAILAGFLPIDDGWIYYEWDSINQTMRLFLWQGDGWTEIFIGPEDLDPSDPPDPPILN